MDPSGPPQHTYKHKLKDLERTKTIKSRKLWFRSKFLFTQQHQKWEITKATGNNKNYMIFDGGNYYSMPATGWSPTAPDEMLEQKKKTKIQLWDLGSRVIFALLINVKRMAISRNLHHFLKLQKSWTATLIIVWWEMLNVQLLERNNG
jgi:hypothetical protein